MKRLLVLALLGALAGPALASKEQLVVDLVNEPATLDPHRQWNPDSYYVYRNVFDNLLTRDDAGAIQGEIAVSWKYLSDSEIEFRLRNDVRYHDGSALTADDVAFSIQRILDPAFASPQRGQFDKIASTQVMDPQTLRIRTDGPYPGLLAQLVKLSVVPRQVVQKMGDQAFNAAPIGSGPYRFSRWQRGVGVILERNPDYWGKAGVFERVNFRAVPDAATRQADLQSGTADLAVSLDSDQAGQLANSPRARLLSAATERVAFLRLNPSKPPFDNLQVRRAAALAIDRDAINQALLGGRERPLNQMLTPSHIGWSDALPPSIHDPDQARALLAAAGPGTELELSTTPVFDQRVIQALQQMLEEVGFKVRISMADMATFLQRSQGDPKQDGNLGFGRWSCACQDADGVLYPLLYSQSNSSNFHDAESDRLLLEARSTLDEPRRAALYRQVNQRINEQVPMIPLFQSVALYGASKSLQWQPTANESLFINRMAWSQ
ncbi:MAG TPA: ABC transporter substrate-binding protein [Pseudomonas sp.]|uniref:ABC transporter substrate-binding protein n=1 Tax=Pseudomonas sp. TaxID=306 RepID=UPI002B45F7A0|nr:ABC transporter substrate-binding protein [Pseudomonas sp.]HKS15571.1 ABC transporter substrate-binding protein [Pseudomonas sp.]